MRNWRTFCRGLFVGILFLLLHPTIVAQEQGCFELQPPSCDNNSSSSVESDINAQEVCLLLDSEYLGDEYTNLSAHQELLNAIPADSELCSQAQLVYHECYFCDLSSFCFADTDACEPPNVTDPSVDTEAFCNFYLNELPFDQWLATKELCYQAEQSIHTCQDYCSDDYPYLGADTEAKKKAIAWTSRIAAFLSLIGAIYILWDVLRVPKNRKNVYHQLLLGMACFDVCTAVAWAFGTTPLPPDALGGIFGASGTYATCTAQGFFVQLGYTSVFYNVSLACYYVLVIRYAWSELQLKRRLRYLHGGPLLVGFGLALGGIPIYGPMEYGCHISFWLQPLYITLIFFAIPIGLSIILISVGMLSVYIKVRNQTRASRRYSLTTSNLERKVFWQCLSYGLAFYITWPIQYTVYLAELDYVADNFGFTMVVAFVAPLQGFNNFLVYIRPRCQRYLQKKKKRLSVDSIFFWRQSSVETAQESQQGGALETEESSVASQEEEEYEPSVKIAEQNLLRNHSCSDIVAGNECAGVRMNEGGSDAGSDEVGETSRVTNTPSK